MVIQIQNLLVEDVILKQDQILLRRPLELRQILADVEHDLLIGNEPHSIPWNRQRRVAEGARNDDLRDFREFAGFDDREITQPPDLPFLHEDAAAEDLAQEELLLDDGSHGSYPCVTMRTNL